MKKKVAAILAITMLFTLMFGLTQTNKRAVAAQSVNFGFAMRGINFQNQYKTQSNNAATKANGDGSYNIVITAKEEYSNLYELSLITNIKSTAVKDISLKVMSVTVQNKIYTANLNAYNMYTKDTYCKILLRNPYPTTESPVDYFDNEQVPIKSGGKIVIKISFSGIANVPDPYATAKPSPTPAPKLKLSVSPKTVKNSYKAVKALKLSWTGYKGTASKPVYLFRKKSTQTKYKLYKKVKNGVSYTDKAAGKGKKYDYFIALTETGVGPRSNVVSGKVKSNITIKPSFSLKRKRGYLNIKWKKAEGSYYVIYYKFHGGNWTKASLSSNKTKISKVSKLRISGKGFSVRVKTYDKVNGRKYYSKYSKSHKVI